LNILILGSEGFIGSHLVEFYKTKNGAIHGADLYEVGTQPYHYHKISRLSPEYDEILQDTPFDLCINAAGSGNVPYSVTHPVSDFEANALDTVRILDGLRKFQPQCRYLHISSAAVYGNPVQIPVHEESRLNPISPYGWHKLISESICKEYHSVYKMSVAIVRPFSVYGPGLRKQLFWDLAKKCEATRDQKIDLWGNGKESRDFIFIDDLMGAFHAVINSSRFQADVYNIATSVETSVYQASKMFVGLFNSNIKIEFSNSAREGDPQNWCADISRIQTLGFYPQVSLQDGLQRLILWMKSLK
jgi:nucleoside-diphosphate-sugar epimerase